MLCLIQREQMHSDIPFCVSLAQTFSRTHSFMVWYVRLAFPTMYHRSLRSKIVPVLPFSLRTRSGIDEEHSKSHRLRTVMNEFALAKLVLQ